MKKNISGKIKKAQDSQWISYAARLNDDFLTIVVKAVVVVVCFIPVSLCVAYNASLKCS